jgi:diphthamide synthase (EF-2-diphthine--ammonia ligase)
VSFPASSSEHYEARFQEAITQAKVLNISFMAFGDLFLDDVRAYRERMLAGSGIALTFPFWGRPTAILPKEMLACGIKGVLTCVDPRKLDSKFAGRDFDGELLAELPPGVDPCGENGEFHTFVHAAPGFREPISIRKGEIAEREGFFFADVLKGF